MGGQCETRSNGTGPSTNRPVEDGRYKENNPKSLPLAVACSRGGVSGLPASADQGRPREPHSLELLHLMPPVLNTFTPFSFNPFLSDLS